MCKTNIFLTEELFNEASPVQLAARKGNKQVKNCAWETLRQRSARELHEKNPSNSANRVREFRAREEEESDSDDSIDDIPSPGKLILIRKITYFHTGSLSPCILGGMEDCPYCSVEHYPGGHVCCDKGMVFIKPMRKLPAELHNLMFGKGFKAKQFRARIISYNNSFAFASIQYNRIPAAAHGVQSMKVQGRVLSRVLQVNFRKPWAFSFVRLALC